MTQYLIVDCLSTYVNVPVYSSTARCARIGPHPVCGWDVVVVEYGGEKLYIPRDGVPRCRATAKFPFTQSDLEPMHEIDYSRMKRPEYSCNVTDRTGKVLVTMKPEGPLVKDLKKAVKDRHGAQFSGFDASIIIKAPAGTVLGDRDLFDEQVEYVFELPAQ